MKIYISLPITGRDMQERTQTASAIKEQLREVYPDAEIFNPMDMYDPSEGMQSWETYMARDIKHLYTCTHIYFHRGWESSKGCRLEYAIAKEQGIERIYIRK